jgi:hypothetical protein
MWYKRIVVSELTPSGLVKKAKVSAGNAAKASLLGAKRLRTPFSKPGAAPTLAMSDIKVV